MYFWLTKYQLKRNNENNWEYRFPTNLKIFMYLCSTSQPYCFSNEEIHPLTLKSSESPAKSNSARKKTLLSEYRSDFIEPEHCIFLDKTNLYKMQQLLLLMHQTQKWQKEQRSGIKQHFLHLQKAEWVSIHTRAKWEGCLYKHDF